MLVLQVQLLYKQQVVLVQMLLLNLYVMKLKETLFGQQVQMILVTVLELLNLPHLVLRTEQLLNLVLVQQIQMLSLFLMLEQELYGLVRVLLTVMLALIMCFQVIVPDIIIPMVVVVLLMVIGMFTQAKKPVQGIQVVRILLVRKIQEQVQKLLNIVLLGMKILVWGMKLESISVLVMETLLLVMILWKGILNTLLQVITILVLVLILYMHLHLVVIMRYMVINVDLILKQVITMFLQAIRPDMEQILYLILWQQGMKHCMKLLPMKLVILLQAIKLDIM